MEVKLPDLTINDFVKLIAEKEIIIMQLKKLIEESISGNNKNDSSDGRTEACECNG